MAVLKNELKHVMLKLKDRMLPSRYLIKQSKMIPSIFKELEGHTAYISQSLSAEAGGDSQKSCHLSDASVFTKKMHYSTNPKLILKF